MTQFFKMWMVSLGTISMSKIGATYWKEMTDMFIELTGVHGVSKNYGWGLERMYMDI